MYTILCEKTKNPYRKYMFHDWHGAPTYNEKRMLDATMEGLLDGVFYNTDMYEVVKEKMADILEDSIFEDLKNGTNKTELGKFGTDIYYARQSAERILTFAANMEVMRKLLVNDVINVGSKLKNIRYGSKKFSTCEVTEIHKETGEFSFVCTARGSKNRYVIKLGANDTRLIEAITNKDLDASVKIKNDDGIKIYLINLGGNRQQELSPQF